MPQFRDERSGTGVEPTEPWLHAVPPKHGRVYRAVMPTPQEPIGSGFGFEATVDEVLAGVDAFATA